MSDPNPGGQFPEKPTFRDPAGKTGNSRLWIPALVVILAFLIGAAVLVLTGALGGAADQEPATATPETADHVQAPGAY